MDDRYGIPERESEAVEFKLSMSEIDAAIKSGSAMLNSSSGGVVYIGVRDDGTIVGLEVGDRTHDKIATALTKISPGFWPEITTIETALGRTILCLRFPGNTGIYRYAGKPYIRIGASNHELQEDQYQKRIIEQFHTSDRWELRVAGLTLEDIDISLLEKVIDDAISNGRLIDPGTRDPSALLQGLGLMSAGQINNAAAVLLGKQQSMQLPFPQCLVRLARFEGVTKNNFRDNRQQVGNIFDLLRVSSLFVGEHNPIRSQVIADQIKRRDTPVYNPEVVREALVNAFAHRDYAQPGGAVDIAIYDDRMEITSTGGLRFGLTVDDLLTVHQSRPWNPIIANVLQRQGFFESWGRGTTRMVELSRIAGVPDPVFVDGRHSFTVQLLRDHTSTKMPEDIESRILAVLAVHGERSASEIASLLEWTGSVRQMRTVLNRLRDSGSLEVVGSGRGGRWKLKNVRSQS